MLVITGDPTTPTEEVDTPAGEGSSRPRPDPALVQDLGDLIVGMIPGQRRDQIEGLPAGPAGLAAVHRDRHVAFGRAAPPPADLPADIAPPRQGDVLDQEPQHPLAIPRRGPRVIPHRREVSCQPQDVLTGLRGEGDTARLSPPDQRPLRLGKGPEPLVPTPLEGLGDE